MYESDSSAEQGEQRDELLQSDAYPREQAVSIPWFRTIYSGGLFLYLLFIIADQTLYPSLAPTFLLIRLAVLLPLGIAALLLTRGQRFPVFAEAVNLVLLTAAGLSVLLMFLLAKDMATVHLIAAGLVPVLLFGYLLLRLRFRNALLVCLGLTAVLAVLMLAAVETQTKPFLIILLFLLAVNAIGAPAAWLLEKNSKTISRLGSQLEELSSYDKLTGLRNRLFYDEFISEEISRFITDRKQAGGRETRSGGNPDDCYGLYLLDIDRFRDINDRHGHSAGDGILKQFAALLTGSVRGADAVFRWNGEEFIIILRNAHTAFLPVFAAKIVQAVRNRKFTLPDGKTVSITASAGFTGIPLDDVDNPEQILLHANSALQEAKEAGRDRAVQAVFRDNSIAFEPVLRIFERTGGSDNGSVLF